MEQAGKADFDLLEKKAIAWGEPKVGSAKQVTPILDCLRVIEFDVFVNNVCVVWKWNAGVGGDDFPICNIAYDSIFIPSFLSFSFCF